MTRTITIFLAILNAAHLALLSFMPMGGAIVFYKGVFFAVLENNRSILNLGDSSITLINIVSSVLYLSSIIIAVLIPFLYKMDIRKQLILEIILTSVPIILLVVRFGIFP